MSEHSAKGDAHECVFIEEQEPSGRLVLPPCLVCGLAAMDALEQLRATNPQAPADYHEALSRVREYLAALDGFFGDEEVPNVLDTSDGDSHSPALLLSDVRTLATRPTPPNHEAAS